MRGPTHAGRTVAPSEPRPSTGTGTVAPPALPEAPAPPAGDLVTGPPAAAPVSPPNPNATPEQAAPAPALSPRVRRPRRILLAVLVVAVLLQIVGFTGAYLGYSRHYVSTDNAQVDGDKITVNAPATGIVKDWTGAVGTTLTTRQVLGHILIQGGRQQPGHTIKAPGPGTISMDMVANGEYVRAGTPMALAYNVSRTYVTARVDETDSARIRVGQPVDISVDAYPGRRVSGIVEVIQGSSSGEFTPFPSADIDPVNPQKEQQYVPVRVAFIGTGGLSFFPGMNATVHIRTDR